MNNIEININKIDKIDEVMMVAETVFQPNDEEKAKYHRKEDWLEKIKNGLLVTVSIDKKIVGFAVCYRKDKTLHVWNVGVLPDYRENGVWQKMYEMVVFQARESEYEAISLNTYKEKFPGMYNFCQTHGFFESKTEKDELPGAIKSMFVRKL